MLNFLDAEPTTAEDPALSTTPAILTNEDNVLSTSTTAFSTAVSESKNEDSEYSTTTGFVDVELEPTTTECVGNGPTPTISTSQDPASPSSTSTVPGDKQATSTPEGRMD